MTALYNYIEDELIKINLKTVNLSLKINDYEGNTTMTIGMNDVETLLVFRDFINRRLKHIRKGE